MALHHKHCRAYYYYYYLSPKSATKSTVSATVDFVAVYTGLKSDFVVSSHLAPLPQTVMTITALHGLPKKKTSTCYKASRGFSAKSDLLFLKAG